MRGCTPVMIWEWEGRSYPPLEGIEVKEAASRLGLTIHFRSCLSSIVTPSPLIINYLLDMTISNDYNNSRRFFR